MVSIVKGFALFSIFVGIIMLGIAISIAASVQSQALQFTRQVQYRESEISSVSNAALATMDAITTFEEALQSAIYNQQFVYKSNLATSKAIIKNAAADFMRAITAGEISLGGRIISYSIPPKSTVALQDATTVKYDYSTDALIVNIKPNGKEIPFIEMNVYRQRNQRAPTTVMKFPMFPPEINTTIAVYLPVARMKNDIKDLNTILSKTKIYAGFVGESGTPSILTEYDSTEAKYSAPAQQISDPYFPLKAILPSPEAISEKKQTFIPGYYQKDIQDLINKILQKTGKGYTLTEMYGVRFGKTSLQMPFAKFVCLTGKLADAIVADPTSQYTVCVNITDGASVSNVISNASTSGGTIQLPYTYVKQIGTIVFKDNKMKPTCGEAITNARMEIDDVNLENPNNTPPPHTPSTMAFNAKELPPANEIENKLKGKYVLQWGRYCGNLSNIGKCSDAEKKREDCWNWLDGNFEECNTWISKLLGDYVKNPVTGSYCGMPGNEKPSKYEKENSQCCGSGCKTKIVNDPNTWWSRASGPFVDTRLRLFEFNVSGARAAVKEWIKEYFEQNCANTVPAPKGSLICGDIESHLENFTNDNAVYILQGSIKNPETIAKDLLFSGGGLMSITIIDTGPRADTQWKEVNAGLIFCNNSKCHVVATQQNGKG